MEEEPKFRFVEIGDICKAPVMESDDDIRDGLNINHEKLGDFCGIFSEKGDPLRNIREKASLADIRKVVKGKSPIKGKTLMDLCEALKAVSEARENSKRLNGMSDQVPAAVIKTEPEDITSEVDPGDILPFETPEVKTEGTEDTRTWDKPKERVVEYFRRGPNKGKPKMKRVRMRILTRDYPCGSCGKAFASAAHLKRHEEIHAPVRTKPDDKNFPCGFCPKSFLYISTLRRHERIHTGKNLIFCHFCQKPFTNPSHLHKHERMHTGERPFVCEVCPKTFTDKSLLKTHEKTHLMDKPFRCEICSKIFSYSATLDYHMKTIHTETEDMAYNCRFCGKGYAKPSLLVRHERNHTGEKPYECVTCHKWFSDPANLRKHTKLHKERPVYPCDVCGKVFLDKIYLKHHKMKHKKEKIAKEGLPCPACPERFGDAASFNEHRRKHAKSKVLFCQHCEETFLKLAELEEHVKAKHEVIDRDDLELAELEERGNAQNLKIVDVKVKYEDCDS